jgi:O-antigen/teichoic acid export membrane protein
VLFRSISTVGFLAIVLTQMLAAPFQVAANMRAPVLADAAGRVVLVAGLAVVAWRGLGLHAMVAVTAAANVVTFGITFLAARRLLPIRLACDADVWASIIRRSWPIALSILFNLVYLRADQVLLSLLKPSADVGLYAAPYRLIDVLTQFPHMVMGLVLPVLAVAWARRDRVAFAHRTQRTFDGLALLAFPLAAGAIVLGTPLMTFVSGAEFAGSGPILALLAFALLGIFLGAPFGYAVVALGVQRRMLVGYAVVAAATLTGYLITIPLWSYWGAAWMTIASETAIAVWTFAVVRRASGLRLSLRIAGSAFLAAAAMGVAVAFVSIPILPRIGLGAIVYGLLAYALSPTRAMLRATFDRN